MCLCIVVVVVLDVIDAVVMYILVVDVVVIYVVIVDVVVLDVVDVVVVIDVGILVWCFYECLYSTGVKWDVTPCQIGSRP